MLTLLTLLSPDAHAYVYWGNPKLKLEIDRKQHDLIAGDVDLIGVRVHKCSGGYTAYNADINIDPVAGWEVDIDGGDLCSVDVLWDSVGLVWSSAFELKSSASSHSVSLVGTTSKTPWTPFTVINGTFTGATPEVVITIQ